MLCWHVLDFTLRPAGLIRALMEVWSRASDLEEVHDSTLEYDAFEQVRPYATTCLLRRSLMPALIAQKRACRAFAFLLPQDLQPLCQSSLLSALQGRMLGDMDHDSASLLPDTEAAFSSEHPPRQPNSKDAADTLTQFAFRLQGRLSADHIDRAGILCLRPHLIVCLTLHMFVTLWCVRVELCAPRSFANHLERER
jgi:hypothetical protein